MHQSNDVVEGDKGSEGMVERIGVCDSDIHEKGTKCYWWEDVMVRAWSKR